MSQTENSPRMQPFKLAPAIYQAMSALEQAAKSGIEPSLAHLVKFRASQINGCAYCLDMHSKDARAAGESEQRLHLLPAWRESSAFYTEKEQAALALTEAVTLLADTHVPDEVYERAAKHFPDEELAHLIGVIVAINAWNRFSVTCRTPPGSYQARRP